MFFFFVFGVFCVGKVVSVGRDLQNSIYQCVNFCCEGEKDRERERGKMGREVKEARGRGRWMGWEE